MEGNNGRHCINRPIKELKGFDKVFVEAGQMKKATIRIPKKYATSFWDEHRNAWVQEMDRYSVLVGVSNYKVRPSQPTHNS